MATGMTLRPAVIIGNGPSRKGINLQPVVDALPTFGCNMIIEEIMPTYVVAIDEPVIQRLYQSDYPFHRILTPIEIDRWEPPALHQGSPHRPRSNTGINAMMEATKRGFKHLYLIGLDFMIEDENFQIGNMYAGKPGYENTITPPEALGRVRYFNYLAANSVDVHYTFVFPEEIIEDNKVITDHPPNVNYISYQKFFDEVVKKRG